MESAFQVEKGRSKGAGGMNQLYVSATFTDRIERQVQKIAGGGLKILKPDNYLKQAVREGVNQKRVMVKRPEDRAQKLAELFPVLANSGGSCLVFLTTRKGANMVGEHLSQAKKLTEMGLTVDVLSGEKTPEERDTAFAKFNAGETKIMMATDVLCRGINIPSINFVVHYDLPVFGNPNNPEPDVTTYIHRCGRCARFTNKGVSLAFEVESHPVTTAVLDKMERHFQAENAEEQVAGRPAVDIAAITPVITPVTADDPEIIWD